MPIQFQAGDVFNPAPGIPKGGKQLWAFYGPDGKWRNHYGYLEMMGYDNKPTETFNPVLIQYKEKIFPVNRIHSAWPGIEIEGKSGLMQPRMSDIYKMWTKHREDSTKYPSLSQISDDNSDGVPEVNRPEEINALIEAVSHLLSDIGYPMEGKRVVWVYNDKVYKSGSEYTLVEKEPWEASPFANVHKYSHDIYPAKAALGKNGCQDCHASNSRFFFAGVTQYPFNADGKPVLVSQFKTLGKGKMSVGFGIFRETILRLAFLWGFPILLVVLLLHYVVFGPRIVSENGNRQEETGFCLIERVSHLGILVTFITLALTGFVTYSTNWLSVKSIDTVHDFHHVAGFAFAFFALLTAILWRRDTRWHPCDREWFKRLGGYFGFYSESTSMKFNAGQKVFFWTVLIFSCTFLISGILLIIDLLRSWEGIIYTIHISVAFLAVAALIVHLYLSIFLNPGTIPKMFKGTLVRK
jgi:formate dehydrogenase subunit gamma